MKLTNLIISTVLSALLLSGCMNEDTTVCRQDVVFHYSYVFNKDNDDLFDEQVKVIELFIYDDKGNLVKTVTNNTTKDITISGLPAGKYRAVSWANISDKHYEVGDFSRMDTHTVTLKTVDGVAVNTPNGMFHNFTEFETDARTITTVDVSLIKNTNRIKIIIEAQSIYSPVDDASATITGSNSSYNFDNTLVDNQPSIIYNPLTPATQNGQTLVHEFDVMRLLVGDDLQANILYGGEPIASIPIVSTLIENFPTIKTNEDLDRYDQYELKYNLTDTKALILTSITVNDWTHVISNGVI